ncbi:MAG: hypothetical protein FWB87_04085 [Defluviitaleaceae bacterium]|nr:hypothetical protein [Defluviitaleaceae bacterium]
MRKIFAKILAVAAIYFAVAAFAMPVHAAPGYTDAKNAALDWLLEAAPDGAQVGGVVGEWAVRALALAGRIDAQDPWTRAWLTDLDASLAQLNTGATPATLRRWTDLQRITLALGALGLDATNYNGRDLTADFRFFIPNSRRATVNRTITADIYALIALESVGRTSPWFFSALLQAQRPDGTWSINPAQATSAFDIDITAMAVQALVPFYREGNPRAVTAVQRASQWLTAQTPANAESTAQVILAFTALGEGYNTYASYYVAHLLQWFDPALGGFTRPSVLNQVNAMSTVQAAYALAVYHTR